MPLNENTAASKNLVLELTKIGRVAVAEFELRIARPAGLNHRLRIIDSNVAAGDLRRRPGRAPAATPRLSTVAVA